MSKTNQPLTGLDINEKTMKRAMEEINSAKRMTELVGLDGSAREAVKRATEKIDSVKRMTKLAGLDGTTQEAMKRAMEGINSVKRMSELAGLDGNAQGEIKRAIEGINSAGRMTRLAGLGVSDELKRSLEQESRLASNVDRAIENMRILAPRQDGFGPIHDRMEIPEMPVNPIWETNRQLTELTGSVMQLVEVARQQAELSQAIRNTSDHALENSIQSGNEAKAATQLARKSVGLTRWAIIVSSVIAILSNALMFYVNQGGNSTGEALRQEEIRILRDISSELKGLRAQTSTLPANRPQSSQSLKPIGEASKRSARYRPTR